MEHELLAIDRFAGMVDEVNRIAFAYGSNAIGKRPCGIILKWDSDFCSKAVDKTSLAVFCHNNQTVAIFGHGNPVYTFQDFISGFGFVDEGLTLITTIIAEFIISA